MELKQATESSPNSCDTHTKHFVFSSVDTLETRKHIAVFTDVLSLNWILDLLASLPTRKFIHQTRKHLKLEITLIARTGTQPTTTSRVNLAANS